MSVIIALLRRRRYGRQNPHHTSEIYATLNRYISSIEALQGKLAILTTMPLPGILDSLQLKAPDIKFPFVHSEKSKAVYQEKPFSHLHYNVFERTTSQIRYLCPMKLEVVKSCVVSESHSMPDYLRASDITYRQTFTGITCPAIDIFHIFPFPASGGVARK